MKNSIIALTLLVLAAFSGATASGDNAVRGQWPLQWSVNLTALSREYYALGPIVADDTACYLMFRSAKKGPSVAALRLDDGAVLWKTVLDIAAVNFMPAVGAGIVAVTDQVSSTVHVLNAATGRILWRKTIGNGPTGTQINTAPSVIDGDVFVNAANPSTTESYIVRLGGSSGNVVWQSGNETGFNQPVSDVTLIKSFGPYIYTFGKGTHALRDYVLALDKTTGAVAWSKRMMFNYGAHKQFLHDLQIFGGNVVLLTHKMNHPSYYGTGLVLALNALNGTRPKNDAFFGDYCGFERLVLTALPDNSFVFGSSHPNASDTQLISQSYYRVDNVASMKQSKVVSSVPTYIVCGQPQSFFQLPVAQTVVDGVLVYGSSTNVHGVDVATGATLFTFPYQGGAGRGGFVAAGPGTVVGGVSMHGTDASIVAFAVQQPHVVPRH